jgi:hypothetical protein
MKKPYCIQYSFKYTIFFQHAHGKLTTKSQPTNLYPTKWTQLNNVQINMHQNQFKTHAEWNGTNSAWMFCDTFHINDDGMYLI